MSGVAVARARAGESAGDESANTVTASLCINNVQVVFCASPPSRIPHGRIPR